MTFYKGHIEFSDGRSFDDYYVNKDDALSQYESAPHFTNCIRAEVFEYKPDADNAMYEATCIYEYDANGKYYYDVA